MHLIKCIQVLDNVPNGGAFASVIDGGVNRNTTKILLKSQPGGPIRCKITIFSYRNETALYPKPALGWNMQQPPNVNSKMFANPRANAIPNQRRLNIPWPALH